MSEAQLPKHVITNRDNLMPGITRIFIIIQVVRAFKLTCCIQNISTDNSVEHLLLIEPLLRLRATSRPFYLFNLLSAF